MLHNEEQDRQYTYSETLRCVLATTVVVEKQRVLHNLSVCEPFLLPSDAHNVKKRRVIKTF